MLFSTETLEAFKNRIKKRFPRRYSKLRMKKTNRREIAKKSKISALKQNKKSNANTKVKNLTFKVWRSYSKVEGVGRILTRLQIRTMRERERQRETPLERIRETDSARARCTWENEQPVKQWSWNKREIVNESELVGYHNWV